MTTDLAVRQIDPADLAPRFVQSLDDMKAQVQELDRFKREIMVDGVDYGTIPGTPKPTLLKPGAEKLSLVFGLAPTFVSTTKIEDWEGGFFFYDEECRLTSKRTGEVVASANGSANSREPRYRYRKAERVCPACEQATIFKSKNEGEGWYCWVKKGGCSAQFSANDQRITGQTVGNVPNPEPFELVNTIKKMAQKRALVAATLIATGGSGVWTQDVEDMPSMGDDGEVIEGNGRVIEQERPRPQPPAAPALKITSADSRIWKRWLELLAQAQGLGIKGVNNIRLPIARQELSDLGAELAQKIDERKAEFAAQQTAIHGSDDDGTAFADLPAPPSPAQDARPRGEVSASPSPAGKSKGKPVPMVDSVDHHAYQKLAALFERAAELDIDMTPYMLEYPEPVSKYEAAIAGIESDIAKVEASEVEALTGAGAF